MTKELVIPVEDLTKPIIDAYSTDQTVTHEIKPTGPVIVVRKDETIAAIKATEAQKTDVIV